MKYISITFDDGRKDTYTRAYAIMKKYGIVGTVFVTTGYVDNTWERDVAWDSAEGPMSVEELVTLDNEGWEIALHGDKHLTDWQDTQVSIQKLNAWLGQRMHYGFSMPNSSAPKEKIAQLEAQCGKGKPLSYIRRGRGINTKGLKAKVLFGLYSVLKSQWAYDRFNLPSVQMLQDMDVENVKSVVIRSGDDHKMLSKFIDKAPEDSLIVLMFHSILQKEDACYGADSWYWDTNEFESFCREMKEKQEMDKIKMIPVERVLDYVEI